MSAKKRKAWGSADAWSLTAREPDHAEPIDDDAAPWLRIIHRAGCVTPTTIAMMPWATSLGRNPYIEVVADGKGGELLRCRVCGMVEGQPAWNEAESRRRREIVDAYQAVVDDDRFSPTVDRVAERLNLSESSLKRERKRLGMTGWPPTLDPK